MFRLTYNFLAGVFSYLLRKLEQTKHTVVNIDVLRKDQHIKEEDPLEILTSKILFQTFRIKLSHLLT